MPIEYQLLKNRTEHYTTCPHCSAAPFESFMRGQVQRSRWPFWYYLIPGLVLLAKKLEWYERPYCSYICSSCKTILGHEHPRGHRWEDPWRSEYTPLNKFKTCRNKVLKLTKAITHDGYKESIL